MIEAELDSLDSKGIIDSLGRKMEARFFGESVPIPKCESVGLLKAL